MAEPGRSERLLVNGCSLYYERRGTGLPLYAVHGGPGLDHTTLAAGMAGIESVCEVFYIDLRGHGRSDRGAPELCTLQQMADDLEELRRINGHERIVLLGHSMGGKVALLYALKHPRRLEALILLGVNASPPRYAWNFLTAPGRFLARCRLLNWALGDAVRSAIGRPWSLERTWRAYWGSCWPLYTRRKRPPRHLGSILVGALKPPLDVIPPLMLELATLDLSRLLDQIRVRALILCGEEDVLFSREQHLLSRIPGSILQKIPHAGHFAHIDQPDLVAQAVVQFLRLLSQAR